MANYSLILKAESSTILQIVTSKEDKFEIHEDFMWVDGPEELVEGKSSYDYEYKEGQGVVLKDDPLNTYDLSRRMNYPSVSEQLDQLWHDMNSGIIPGKKDSIWFKSIQAVKQQYPKS